jgi:hypothetical protein
MSCTVTGARAHRPAARRGYIRRETDKLVRHRTTGFGMDQQVDGDGFVNGYGSFTAVWSAFSRRTSLAWVDRRGTEFAQRVLREMMSIHCP